jgi:hypothetical protein
VELKDWLARMPSVDEARPSHCPGCGAASRPVGGPLVLYGHGCRERQVRGPLEPGGPPSVVTIRLRRYLCRACGAVATVAPRGTVCKRLYSAAAIALALVLWAVEGMPESEVRQRVCPWAGDPYGATTGWTALRRWARAAREGRLFPGVRRAPEGWSLRRVAERVATTLAALAPPPSGGPLSAQAFRGAARAG